MPYSVDTKPRSDYDVFTSDEDLPTVLNRLFDPRQHDVDMLTKTAIGEARGEGEEGMLAVMHAILNRRKRLPNASIEQIVTAPKQFSMYNEGDPNLEAAENYPKRDAIASLAEAALQQTDDPTGGATFYYNPKKADPNWAGAMEHTTTIGNHVFMREPRRRKK